MACSRAKVTHLEQSGVEKIPIPGARFSHVHMDLVGPLPANRDGSTSFLVMIDCSTRCPEAVTLGCIDADTLLEAFITTWVACFGVPARITTDRGNQFTSGMWGDWCRKQGVQHITTTAYHPQANHMVEWIHCTLKVALCAKLVPPHGRTIICPGCCRACVPPPRLRLVYQLQRRPCRSSLWCLVSCCHAPSKLPGGVEEPLLVILPTRCSYAQAGWR